MDFTDPWFHWEPPKLHMETQSDPSILPALNSSRSSTLRALQTLELQTLDRDLSRIAISVEESWNRAVLRLCASWVLVSGLSRNTSGKLGHNGREFPALPSSVLRWSWCWWWRWRRRRNRGRGVWCDALALLTGWLFCNRVEKKWGVSAVSSPSLGYPLHLKVGFLVSLSLCKCSMEVHSFCILDVVRNTEKEYLRDAKHTQARNRLFLKLPILGRILSVFQTTRPPSRWIAFFPLIFPLSLCLLVGSLEEFKLVMKICNRSLLMRYRESFFMATRGKP